MHKLSVGPDTINAPARDQRYYPPAAEVALRHECSAVARRYRRVAILDPAAAYRNKTQLARPGDPAVETRKRVIHDKACAAGCGAG